MSKEILIDESLAEFWLARYSHEDGNKRLKSVRIQHLKLYDLLYEFGFRRYDITNDQFVFVKITDDRIIERVSITQIKDWVINYIEELPSLLGDDLPKELVKDKIVSNPGNFFTAEKLSYLKPAEDLKSRNDPIDSSYRYYINKVVKITAAGIQLIDYKKLDHFVWKHQIIQRQISLTGYVEHGVSARFFQRISYGEDRHLMSRYEALKRITGYLIHHYYEYKLKAVLLTDSGEVVDDDESNGRSGKTLYGKFISHFLTDKPDEPDQKLFVEISGKNFDTSEKHRYQDANIETRVIHINDLKRYFDVEALYNDVTEGITVDKKNHHPFKIRSKILLSTNKTVKIEGNSSVDRFVEFQFTDYFNLHRSPESEFKHWLFRDWSESRWNDFDNFMIDCLHQFLKFGLPEVIEQINLQTRKLYETTSIEWMEFVNDIWKPKNNTHYVKTDVYKWFCECFPHLTEGKYKLSQKRFDKYLVNLCRYDDRFKPFKKDQKGGTADYTYEYRKDGTGVKVIVINMY